MWCYAIQLVEKKFKASDEEDADINFVFPVKGSSFKFFYVVMNKTGDGRFLSIIFKLCWDCFVCGQYNILTIEIEQENYVIFNEGYLRNV